MVIAIRPRDQARESYPVLIAEKLRSAGIKARVSISPSRKRRVRSKIILRKALDYQRACDLHVNDSNEF